MSKGSISFYSSTFFKCLMAVGLVVASGDIIYEIFTESFHGINVITGLWALATYAAYFIGKTIKSEMIQKVIMWIVLISLISRPIFIRFC